MLFNGYFCILNHPFILKFSSITNLSDARYAAGSWADFIGFCFDPSKPSYIEPQKAKEIASWITGPMVCGEFGNQPPEWINDFVKSMPLIAIQIPGNYPFAEIFALENIKFIVEIKDISEVMHTQNADVFITKDTAIYKHLKLHNTKPVILEVENLEVDASVLDGIAFIGGNEEKPGTRNHVEWTEFLEKWSVE